MPLTRPAVAALFVAAIGLICLPACGKKAKPTDPDSPPNQNPNAGPGGPPPGPGASTSGRDPQAPRSPIFSQQGPLTAAARADAENNVKMIMIGMHEYHVNNNSLPGGFADKTGKPGLSWRVAILPYIEQNNLFQQFKLDEPWDSDNNKKLISMMPAIYAPPRTSTNGYTFYRGFTGPNTWLPPQQQSVTAGQAIRGVSFSAISDGLSNTVLVAEAYDPVIWTKPDEMQFTANTVPKLGGVFSSGFVAGLGDGSVRFVRNSVSPKTLANAIQINDGNIVNFDE